MTIRPPSRTEIAHLADTSAPPAILLETRSISGTAQMHVLRDVSALTVAPKERIVVCGPIGLRQERR